jgi:hypothetical protein
MRIGLPAGALVLAGLASAVGTPHVLLEQRCATYDRGRHCAYVISCEYIGIQGYRKIFPEWTPEVQPCSGVAWLPLAWPIARWRDAPKLLPGER